MWPPPSSMSRAAESTAQMISNVMDRITNIWLPAVGGNRDALVLGFELAQADDTAGDMMSTVTAVKSWASVAPLRGAFVWNTSAEHANGGLFVSGVAPAVAGKAPARSGPAPPPAPKPAPTPPRAPPRCRRITTIGAKAGSYTRAPQSRGDVRMHDTMPLPVAQPKQYQRRYQARHARTLALEDPPPTIRPPKLTSSRP